MPFVILWGLGEIFVKNNCAFTNFVELAQWTTFLRPWDPFALIFWQDFTSFLGISSLGDLEKFLPNYEFCRFFLVDDLPPSLGSPFI